MQHNNIPANEQEKILIQKIRSLSPEKLTEVLDFVDFLSHRNNERSFARTANKLAEPAFNKVWDNPEDEVYDNL